MAVETQNVHASDPRNYVVPGRVCLFVRPKGSILNSDWRDLGNILDPSIASVIERLEHFSMRRGQRVKDRTEISQRTAQLNVTIDEINRDNLKFMFGAKTHASGQNVIVPFSKIFTNPGGTGVIQLSPIALEAIGTEVVRATLQEDPDTIFVGSGTDYTYDPVLGTITIVATGVLTDAVAFPEVHIFFQKSVDSQSFEIFDGTEIEVEAQFHALSKVGIQYALEVPNAVIHSNGDFTVGDGTVYQSMPLQLDLLDDGSGKLATMHVFDKAARI